MCVDLRQIPLSVARFLSVSHRFKTRTQTHSLYEDTWKQIAVIHGKTTEPIAQRGLGADHLELRR